MQRRAYGLIRGTPFESCQSEHDADEILSGMIVQIARYPPALSRNSIYRVNRFREAPGHVAEFPVRGHSGV